MPPRTPSILALVFALVVALGGCRSRPASPSPPAPPATLPRPTAMASPLPTPAPTVAAGGPAVALLTSGPVNDGGWNQAAFEGLQALAEQGATIAHRQNVAAGDQVNLLRSYAEGGFDIIIGHGPEFGLALTTVAQEYADVRFLQIGGTASNPGNLASYSFRPGEAGYAAGTLAGLMVESGRLGGLGTVASAASAADFTAFEQAAQRVNPAVQNVPVIYAGAAGRANDATGRAKDAAVNLYESGSELILAHGGIEAAAVSEGAAEVSEGAVLIGWSYRPASPPAAPVLAVVQQRLDEVILAAVAAIEDGEMAWTSHTIGFAEGAHSLVYADRTPAAVAAEVDATIQALIDGKILLDESGQVIEDNYHPQSGDSTQANWKTSVPLLI